MMIPGKANLPHSHQVTHLKLNLLPVLYCCGVKLFQFGEVIKKCFSGAGPGRGEGTIGIKRGQISVSIVKISYF